MRDDVEILWRMCNEHYSQARQHETQRTSMSQVILVIAGALLAFYTSQYSGGEKFWVVPIALACLGIFGAAFCRKQYERSKFHMRAAGLHRDRIATLLNLKLAEIRQAAKAKQKDKFRWAERLRLNHFWT